MDGKSGPFIFAANPQTSVLFFAEDSSKKHPFPCPCTYRTALTHYVDIRTPPRTNVVKEMADYCTDEEERNFLLSMTSTKEESRVSDVIRSSESIGFN